MSKNIYILYINHLINGDISVVNQYDSFTEANKAIPDVITELLKNTPSETLLLDRNCTIENAITKVRSPIKYVIKNNNNNRTEIYSVTLGGLFSYATLKLQYVISVMEIVQKIEIPIAPPPPPVYKPVVAVRKVVNLGNINENKLCVNELKNAIATHQKRVAQAPPKTPIRKFRLTHRDNTDISDIINSINYAKKIN